MDLTRHKAQVHFFLPFSIRHLQAVPESNFIKRRGFRRSACLIPVGQVDAARSVVGDSLHDGHPERLFAAQQGSVDAEAKRCHEDRWVAEGVAQRDVEGRRHDGVGVHEEEKVSLRDARPGIHGRPTPPHRGRRAVAAPARETEERLLEERESQHRRSVTHCCY